MKIPNLALLDDRIGEILQDLAKANAEYALALKQQGHFYDMIDPVLHSKEDVTLSPADCKTLRELLESEITVDGISQEALYHQGYLDCVKLLRSLGVLA